MLAKRTVEDFVKFLSAEFVTDPGNFSSRKFWMITHTYFGDMNFVEVELLCMKIFIDASTSWISKPD